MKGAFTAFVVVACVTLASAKCPNDCSGHGVCDASSQCACYANFFGADCSRRTCTFGKAFVDSPYGDLNGDGALSPSRHFDPRSNFEVERIEWVAGGVSELGLGNYGYARDDRTDQWDEAHFYRECSNKGICDRDTGLCECFPGFSGSGCVRTDCPNDCSGHGVCRLISDNDESYSAWDSDSTQVCQCDAGYTGPDCSLRSCPRGADPVEYNHYVTDSIQGIYWRTITGDVTYTADTHEQYDFLSNKPSTVYYTITFTDEYGDEWVSSLLSIEYTSFCDNEGFCVSTPDFGNYASGTVHDSLESYAQAVNASLVGFPGAPMGGAYIHATAPQLDVSCTGDTSDGEGQSTLALSVGRCSSGDPIIIFQTGFEAYPNADDDADVHVDSLDFRLDTSITAACNYDLAGGDVSAYLSLDGSDNDAFGACFFVKMFNPGVQSPLKVDFFYTPSGSYQGDTVTFDLVSGSTGGSFTEDLTLNRDLVVVANVQSLRQWNEADGDAESTFISTESNELDYCSKRGICDFDTGICDCFSGFSGLRCDDRNAIAYSY